MRYFVRIRDNPRADNYLQPLSLHRLGKRGEILITERWERHSKQWVDNLGMLYRFSGMGGADDYREIVEPEATALIKQWSDPTKHIRDKGKGKWEDRRTTEFQEAKESIQDIEHHVTGPPSIGPRPSLIRGSVVGPLRRVVESQPLYINIPIADSEIEEHKKHVLALFETSLEMELVESAKSHMTLLMSDNCPDQVIDEVINELSLPMAFSVEIGHLEVLESEDGFTLVWAVNPDPALIRLQSGLYNALKRRNIDISEYSDPKSYRPHISLAYNLSHKPDELPSIKPFKILVNGFVVTRKDYREIMLIDLTERGGKDSGYHHVHFGRPGEIGGSRPRSEGPAPSTRWHKKYGPGAELEPEKLEDVAQEEMYKEARQLALIRLKLMVDMKEAEKLMEVRKEGYDKWLSRETLSIVENMRRIRAERQREIPTRRYDPSEEAYGQFGRSNLLVDRMRRFSVLFADEQNEIGEVYSKDGEVLWEAAGGTGYLLFPDTVNAKGNVFIHNHPGGSSFSPDDILAAVETEMAEIHVVNNRTGGYHMIFNYDAIPEIEPGGEPVDRSLWTKSFIYHVSQIASIQMDRWTDEIVAGRMTEEWANRNHYSAIWQKVELQYPDLIDYSETLPKDL